jgi:putative phosphoesterase
MTNILAIGDSHIPRRASSIPKKIDESLNHLIAREKFDYTFFTGDVIKADDFISFLNLNTKNDLFIVIGNMDYYGGNRNAPMHQKLDLFFSDKIKITIGLTHGHQISPRGDKMQLELLANEKNYNILISGHTHKEDVSLTKKGILLLNPGSVTGAWSFIASGNPSFITININESTKEVDLILYQLNIKSDKLNEIHYYFIFDNERVQTKS